MSGKLLSSAQVVKDYRAVLRHMRLLPSFKERSSPLREFVVSQFRQGKQMHGQEQAAEASDRRALANSYATMASNIRELKHLRYLDSGERLDVRDKIKNTAARVGLSVPKFADEFESSLDDQEATRSEEKKA